MKKLFFLLAALAVLSLPSCRKHGIDPEEPETSLILPKEYHPDGIDMGGSVLWASFNLGATDPKEDVLVLRWGEWTAEDGDYRLFNSDKTDYSVYNFTDKLTVMKDEDDPAVVLLGDGWHTPSPEDFQWLADNCEWAFVEYENYNCGVTATSKINGKQLYFPLHYNAPDALGAPQAISTLGATREYATNTLVSGDWSRNISYKIRYSGSILDSKASATQSNSKRTQSLHYRPVKSK